MKQIPMLDLRREYEYMKEEIDSAIKKCLDHQKWILGPEVGELERKIAEYIGGSCKSIKRLSFPHVLSGNLVLSA